MSPHELPSPADARMIRVEAGLSQEALARQVPCTAQTIMRWEAGTSEPSDLLRVRYARALRKLADQPPAWWGGNLTNGQPGVG